MRYLFTHKVNNMIILPRNVLFTSFDYSANISCAPDSHPHSGSMIELSLLMGQEVANVNDELQKTAVGIFSNESADG